MVLLNSSVAPFQVFHGSIRFSLPAAVLWIHNIELRICADEETFNEDVPVSFYEIFTK